MNIGNILYSATIFQWILTIWWSLEKTYHLKHHLVPNDFSITCTSRFLPEIWKMATRIEGKIFIFLISFTWIFLTWLILNCQIYLIPPGILLWILWVTSEADVIILNRNIKHISYLMSCNHCHLSSQFYFTIINRQVVD